MTSRSATDACSTVADHCITCGDEGIPMRVVRAGDPSALCHDQAGDGHEVAVELVGPVEIGDEVLVHAGVAIRRLIHGSALTVSG